MRQEKENQVAKTKILDPYTRTQIDEYVVTAIDAIHDPSSFPACYIIEDREGKTILWAHDINYFSEEMWEHFKDNKSKFDLVALDCTEGNRPAMHYV